MLGLVFQDAVALKVHEVVIPTGLVWCDIEYQEVKHCDESETFVELRERFQNPRNVVEPDRKQTESGGYWSEDDYSDQPAGHTKSARTT